MINSATLQHTIGQNIHSVWYATERELSIFLQSDLFVFISVSRMLHY